MPSRLSQFGFALVVMVSFAAVVHAGAPLLCHEFKIGDAKSLPLGGDAFKKAESYDAGRVVDDALKILDADLAVLARMETMRRAALYIGQDQSRAEALLGALLTRTLDAEVVMDPKVLAMRYFDAGYFAATLQQGGIKVRFGPTAGERGLHGAAPGYAWLVRAYKIGEERDGDIAMALALVTADTRMTEHTMFLELAVKECPADDAARSDLLTWIAQIRGTTLEAIRAKVAAAHARSDG